MEEVMTADQWRALSGTKPLKLPSKMVLTVRDNRLYFMTMFTTLRNEILEKVAKESESTGDKKDITSEEKHKANMVVVDEMRDKVLPAMKRIVVSPPIIIDPKEEVPPGAIFVGDMPLKDFSFLHSYVIGLSRDDEEKKEGAGEGDRSLAPFRDEQSGVDAGQNGAEVQPTPLTHDRTP